MRLIMQLVDYENKMGEEARFVVHSDDSEDQLVEMMRQCLRSMKKELQERRLKEKATEIANTQQFLQ